MTDRQKIADPLYLKTEEQDRQREASIPQPPPPDALKARSCRCEHPWTEYDPDLGRTCIRCGSVVAP